MSGFDGDYGLGFSISLQETTQSSRFLSSSSKRETVVSAVSNNIASYAWDIFEKIAMKLKSAFKFATAVVLSCIIWLVKAKDGRKLVETCRICLEDVFASQMLSTDGCSHRYCRSCMKEHATVKLLEGSFPKCPQEACQSYLTISSCKLFLEPKLIDIMSQKINEDSIPAAERVYCPYPRCSALMLRKEISRRSTDDPVGLRECTKCYKLFCIECLVPWHHNMTCNYHRLWEVIRNPGDMKLKFLVWRKKWRQCLKCNHLIELAQGCYHISCRCGYEFCYTCGAEWINKAPTCSCRIWSLRNIIRRRG